MSRSYSNNVQKGNSSAMTIHKLPLVSKLPRSSYTIISARLNCYTKRPWRKQCICTCSRHGLLLQFPFIKCFKLLGRFTFYSFQYYQSLITVTDFLLGIHLFSKRNLYILGLISGRTSLHNGQSHNITGLVIIHLFL